MYMNPVTNTPKDKRVSTAEEDKVGYYSGTLYLDYPAYVPEGVRVYIITGMKEKKDTLNVQQGGTSEVESQFVLHEIGSGGNIIPPETPMYVRSDTKAGLYDFRRAGEPNYIGWVGKSGEETLKIDGRVLSTAEETNLAATATRITNIESEHGKNILTGTLGTATVERRKVLTLGRESNKGAGTIGFWPYNGTSIAAHRCYITEKDYDDAVEAARGEDEEPLAPTAGSAKGASFFFFGEKSGNDNGGVVTEIQNVEQKPVKNLREGWYTLQGVRLNGRPTQQGIYIYNGKKVKR
jgi:hypothetical protein